MGILRQIYVRMTGEQQLLNENKERSGDTRAIRQNRTHRHGEADKQVAPAPTKLGGAPAVKTAEEDESRRRSSRVNNSSRDEELSAQRRKKKKLDVWGAEDLVHMDVNIYTEDHPWLATTSTAVERLPEDPPYTSTARNVNTGWSYHLYRFYLAIRNIVTTTRRNSFKISDMKWRPTFTQEQKDSRRFRLSHTGQLINVVKEFDWTFRQRSLSLVAGKYDLNYVVIWNGLYYVGEGSRARYELQYESMGIPPVIAEPPYMRPDWFSDKVKYVNTGISPLVASDGRYIYVSIAIAWSKPQYDFFYFDAKGYPNHKPPYYLPIEDPITQYEITPEPNFVSSIFQETGTDGTPIPPTTWPAAARVAGDLFYRDEHVVRRTLSDWRGGRRIFEQGPFDVMLDPIVEGKIFNWKYDTHNPNTSPAFSMTDISYQGDGTKAGEEDFKSMFLSSLADGNPHKQRWNQLKNARISARAADPNYTQTHVNLANDYFSLGSGSSIIQPGFVYYPNTGEALYLGKLKKCDPRNKQSCVLIFPTEPSVYKGQLPRNMTTYDAALLYLPRPSSNPSSYFQHFLTTHDDMLRANWKDVTAEYQWSGVSASHNNFYAHRKKV